jgi:DNA processing protein
LESVLDLIRLNLASGVGFSRLQALLARFGSAEDVFKAPFHQLTAVEGIGEKTASSILSQDLAERAEKEIERAQKEGVQIITFDSPQFPTLLGATSDKPILLYVKGEVDSLSGVCIGVVGTRRPSHYGKTQAEKISRELSTVGLTVVSGLALGIDTEAHSGALSAGGKTVAVLPTGMDSVYPPENRKLAEKIISSGALISEFPFGTPVRRELFPRRNRIIAGLSRGLVVIEAPFGSGALISAQFAADYGREVFALPGRVDSFLCRGCHKLIKDGAKLIENADDILSEIAPQLLLERKAEAKEEPLFAPALSQTEKQVLNTVHLDPKNIDDIAVECKLSPAEVSAALLTLQLKKVVVQLPGNIYARR